MIGAVIDALLPPTGLALLALALLLGRRWTAGVVAVALLIALSTDGMARLLLAGLALPPHADASPPAAILILPDSAPGLFNPSGALPDLSTLKRLQAGAALERRTLLPILVTGGAASAHRGQVPAAMAASLQDEFGVPVRWQEARSRNLWQSAAYSAAMLHEAGISSVFLVAEPWEQRLATTLLRRAGIEVTQAPVRHPDPWTVDLTMFIAFAPAWLDSAAAMREWAALACDALSPCVARMQQAGR